MFPFPFSISSNEDEKIELRVFSYGGKFSSRVVEDNKFIVDLILPETRNAWLIENGIRPYLMMLEVINQLHEKDLDIGGKLMFLKYDPMMFSTSATGHKYQGLRLVFELVNFSTGKK